MCGITGIMSFNDAGRKLLPQIEKSTQQLEYRGPDNQGIYQNSHVALGHRRLSIIDLSNKGNQPFKDDSGNYVLTFNGEFYNYLEHRQRLVNEGVQFKSTSDTEVLLHMLIKEGSNALQHINGFFALAFYNRTNGEILIARDRFGIKPLHVALDNDKIIFASEIKSILSFEKKKEVDLTSLYTYLQLSYIPAPYTIYKGIEKVEPGHFWNVYADGSVNKVCYYNNESEIEQTQDNYVTAQEKLRQLLDNSIERRLTADVEIGAFLSGGIDSSIVATIAASKHKSINTFSMGFEGSSFYDETKFAEMVAKKIGSNHTSYKINNDDLLHHFMLMLNKMDEPFADSSALAMSVLSEKTRKIGKVALSGDGADELFAGYNKHRALLLYQKYNSYSKLIAGGGKILKHMPASRKSRVLNKIRQLEKFSQGAGLSAADRYWFLASFQQADYIDNLITFKPDNDYTKRKNGLLKFFGGTGNEIEQTLSTDLSMVLPDDMLTKVDRMSMQNSLEVRVPFLDHHLVEYARSLPTEYKINAQDTKRILRDAYKDILPEQIVNRAKHGFEVPLEQWFKTELSDLIEGDLLSDELIADQQLFDVNQIRQLRQKMFSSNAGESSNVVYNLIVFNYWWKNNFA